MAKSNQQPVARPKIVDAGGDRPRPADSPKATAAHLADHLLAEFRKDKAGKQPKLTKKEELLLDAFASFVKAHLEKNPPVSQVYVGTGIGLTLRDGTTLLFNSQNSAARSYSTPITKPALRDNQDFLPESGAVGITGRE